MKRGAFWFWVLLAALCGALLVVPGSIAFAASPHDDPDAAPAVFSGTALFQHCTYALDSVLVKDPAKAEQRLAKTRWANVPDGLMSSVQDFAEAGTSLGWLVVRIDGDLTQLSALRDQSRFTEAADIAAGVSSNLTSALSAFNRIKRDVTESGLEFQVSAAPHDGDLAVSYRGLEDKIAQIRDMLSLFTRLLIADVKSISPDQTLLAVLAGRGIYIDPSDLSTEASPDHTSLTLSVSSAEAYVGDNVSFDGTLTSSQGPLPGREIEILLNGSTQMTVRTDDAGKYMGLLEVPFWYNPALDVQTLYRPRDVDIGTYLASLSLDKKLKVLFYGATLGTEAPAQAYPGKDISVHFRIDYDSFQVPEIRRVQAYLDNTLVAETSIASPESIVKFYVDPQTAIGKHTLRISANAAGRYAPVVADTTLEIVRLQPALDMRLPRVILMPGTLHFEGKVLSALGSADNATVTLTLGASNVSFMSKQGGNLSVPVHLGMNAGFAGLQDLTVAVQPAEPWHAAVSAVRRVPVINVVNTGGGLLLLVLLGIYLPSRLRKQLGIREKKKTWTPVVSGLNAIPTTAIYSTSIVPALDEEPEDPRRRIVYWYQRVVALITTATKNILKPQQTLREFALESTRVLGASAGRFMELTRLVERITYSEHQPAARQIEESKRLVPDVKERLGQ